MDGLQAVSLSKADLGFELEELEEAANMVQEEEKLLQTSGDVLRQPAALTTSESSGSSSSECSSSDVDETDDSGDSDGSADESEDGISRGTALIQLVEVTSSQPATDAHADPSTSAASVPEEEDDQDVKGQAAITGWEKPSGHDAADSSSDQTGTDGSVRRPGHAEPKGLVSDFLEVTPRNNPLLIIRRSEDGDTPLPID